MRKEVLVAGTVVFIASFCTLVIELVAGRIMAPYLGVSLYTWTSIIGVVLAGISFGAYIGGQIADAAPRYSTLGWLLFLSGLGALSIPFLTNRFADKDLLPASAGLMVRILLTTTFIFFLPSLFLGMISPVAVRLAVKDLKQTGNVVGRIYAISTLGSILGTFATGFFLISWMGTRTLLLIVALILIVSAPVFGGLFRDRRAYALIPFGIGILAVAAVFHAGLFRLYADLLKPPGDEYIHSEESDYYTIRVKEEKFTRPLDQLIRQSFFQAGAIFMPWPMNLQMASQSSEFKLRVLVLDHLIHSHNDLDDPTYLHYPYLRIYEDIVRWQAARRPAPRSLFIGGGGYTFPYYLEVQYPGSDNTVAEIDPAVTRVAHDFMGIPRSSRIRTANGDARWFVLNSPDQGRYDYIFGDAFNDYSVPYHLTTREFSEQLKRLLKPDGLLLANLIDNFQTGRFLASYVHTLEEVFGKGNVHVMLHRDDWDEVRDGTFIVAASARGLDLADFERALERRPWGMRMTYVLPQDRLRKYLDAKNPILLTDDYVPVDNLLAPLFDERFRSRNQ